MSEFVDDEQYHGAAVLHGISSSAPGSTVQARPVVSFHRRELDLILRIYGHRVASGEWRDYAIDHLKDRAVFSIFRRSTEMPLYRIEKDPKNARRQGAYSVIGTGGAILRRGADLAQVLKVFDRKRHLRLIEA